MKSTKRPGDRAYGRRAFPKAGDGALSDAHAPGLAGCGGASSDADSSSDGLSFLMWAGAAEEEGFRGVIRRNEEKNLGAKIDLLLAPYDDYVKLAGTLPQRLYDVCAEPTMTDDPNT